jgi:TetR/AcrR family transcriptional regulator, cholesterol catabolism regulator
LATTNTATKMKSAAQAAGADGTEQRLLREAAHLFRKQGFAGTSTRELAAAVGLQSASLYHYMDSKEDLLYAICVSGNELMIEAVTKAIEGLEPIEALHAAIRAHLTTAIENRDVYLTTLAEVKSLSPRRRREVQKKRQGYAEVLAGVVERAQEAGDIRTDISADHLMLVLRNLLSWTLFWFRTDGDLSIEQFADLGSKVFLEGAQA